MGLNGPIPTRVEWCWDATHFMACPSSPVLYGIIDVVSPKWIATLLTPEATSTQVKVLFLNALDAEGLLEGLQWRLDQPQDVDLGEQQAPIPLAVSDNGPEMRSDETRAFMALVTIGPLPSRGFTRQTRRNFGLGGRPTCES